MKKVKEFWDLIEVLKKDGYKADSHVSTNSLHKGGYVPFDSNMFNFCGAKPDTDYTWLPEWLEEVEEPIDHSKNIGKWYLFSTSEVISDPISEHVGKLMGYEHDNALPFISTIYHYRYGRPVIPADFGWECK